MWFPSLVMYQEVGQALEELSKARSSRNSGIRACIGLGGLGVFGFRRSRVVFRAGYGRASNAFGMGSSRSLLNAQDLVLAIALTCFPNQTFWDRIPGKMKARLYSHTEHILPPCETCSIRVREMTLHLRRGAAPDTAKKACFFLRQPQLSCSLYAHQAFASYAVLSLQCSILLSLHCISRVAR